MVKKCQQFKKMNYKFKMKNKKLLVEKRDIEERLHRITFEWQKQIQNSFGKKS